MFKQFNDVVALQRINTFFIRLDFIIFKNNFQIKRTSLEAFFFIAFTCN